MDPRGQALKRHAWRMLQFKNGADVAMLNAMLNVIITEKLYDQQYIQTYVEGFDAWKENVKDFTPEEMAPICGVPADTLREVARAYARAESAIIFWGMGVSQHTHGTDNARCLIALSLITGQIGRPGTGLHPLRGQNNVQGASDAGLIPMFFPDYRSVENPEIRAEYEKAWGVKLDPKRGKTVVEIMTAVHHDEIKGMYIEGENPAMWIRPQSCAPGAGASRASRGAGPLPHRDRRLCRRRVAGVDFSQREEHGGALARFFGPAVGGADSEDDELAAVVAFAAEPPGAKSSEGICLPCSSSRTRRGAERARSRSTVCHRASSERKRGDSTPDFEVAAMRSR